MRKTQTLFTMALLVLLGSMGAAQAQEPKFSEIKLFTTPQDFAREGGKNEAAGSILLNSSGQTALQADGAMIMLYFSVPLAADIGDEEGGVTVTGDANPLVTGMAEDDDNDGNGTIMINPGMDAGQNLLIQGVMLDVSGADGAVTVTLKATAGMGDFIRIDGPSSAMVISAIKVGVLAPAPPKAVTVRTRGTNDDGKMVSLTLKESFPGAFMDSNMVTVEFSGIPKGASLEAMVTSNPELPEAVQDEAVPMFTAADAYAMVGAVKDGSVTVTLGGTVGDPRATPTSVTLGLTLTAVPGTEDMNFPLARSSVMARASFTDESGGDDNFADAFTDYVTVFNIRPAQCELLFPVVTVRSPWDTAISVTNPAYEDEMAAGGLTFTFYGIGNVEETYDTTMNAVIGRGLATDGTLVPGSTYQVMVSDILLDTTVGKEFIGHAHLTADYTNCSGVGWVTDFMGVNQAYTATVIDADTGTDTP